MAVQTTYFVGGGDAISANQTGRGFSIPFTINTATTNVAGSDVLKLMDIPAKTLIERVIAHVTTAEGGTLTLDVGTYLSADDTAVDADGFLDGANGNSAGVYDSATETLTLTEGTPNTAATSPAYARGKYFGDGTAYLGVLFNNAADAAIINIQVIGTVCA